MSDDHETALGDALHEIAGRPVDDAELFLDELRYGPDENDLVSGTPEPEGAWFWSWALGAKTSSGRAATPGECHDAACRTLRAALGVPEPERDHGLRGHLGVLRDLFRRDPAGYRNVVSPLHQRDDHYDDERRSALKVLDWIVTRPARVIRRSALRDIRQRLVDELGCWADPLEAFDAAVADRDPKPENGGTP
jgi:hypothetical protein